MDELFGSVTAWVKSATDILILQNPYGTGLGLMSGYAIHGLLVAFSPRFPFIQTAISAGYSPIYMACLMITLINVRPFLKRHEIPRWVEEVFRLIDREEKLGHITGEEAGKQRKQLLSNVVRNCTSATAKQLKGRVASTGRRST